MNLEHIAISVNSFNEINDFYIEFLELKQLRNFVLDKDLSKNIFNVNTDIPVYLLNKGNLTIEIFVIDQVKRDQVNHICFSIHDREKLYKKAQEKAYECIRIKRESSDLIFIKDKSRNIFEIKNM